MSDYFEECRREKARAEKEADLAELFVTCNLKWGVEQAYLDPANCLYVTFDNRWEVQEQAFAVLHRLKRLGVVVTDCSDYEEDGILPLNINVGLSSDPAILGKIRTYLNEEQNPLVKKYDFKFNELKAIFEDNRLEYGNYLQTTTEKAVKALSDHFRSVTNLIFNTDDEYFGDKNGSKVTFTPAPENQLLARPHFTITYGRGSSGSKSDFGPDNALKIELSKAFERAQGVSTVVFDKHSTGDEIGIIEITGNPKRLLHELKTQLYNYHMK